MAAQHASPEIDSRRDEHISRDEDLKLPELGEDIANPRRKPVQGTTPVPQRAQTIFGLHKSRFCLSVSLNVLGSYHRITCTL